MVVDILSRASIYRWNIILASTRGVLHTVGRALRTAFVRLLRSGFAYCSEDGAAVASKTENSSFRGRRASSRYQSCVVWHKIIPRLIKHLTLNDNNTWFVVGNMNFTINNMILVSAEWTKIGTDFYNYKNQYTIQYIIKMFTQFCGMYLFF